MQLSFFGADHEVTGSCHYLQACGKKILIDCGMQQGPDEYEHQEIPFAPGEIDYVLLTHAHIDHSGRLPLLAKLGFRGAICATDATCDLCGIMLRDSAHIQEFEAEWKNRKGKRAGREEIEPMYTMRDAEAAISQLEPYVYNQVEQLCDGIAIRFIDAGHLLGSASIELWVTEEDVTKKLVFSGDVGNLNQPLINDPSYIAEADYVVVESTYGDRLHNPPPDYAESLAQIIQRTFDRGGNVVIPSFAVGRTQEMLYFLRDIKARGLVHGHNNFPVYVDSPLAVEATSIFQDNRADFDEEATELIRHGINPITFLGLHLAITSDESKAINFDNTPKVILSASGMCEAGRIRHHLKNNLYKANATVVFVGYQAVGTLGRIIIDGAKKVKILGVQVIINAAIKQIEGFSGHADQSELLEWVSEIPETPKRIFLVHGEDKAINALKGKLQEKGYSIEVPEMFEEFDLGTGEVYATATKKVTEAAKQRRQQAADIRASLKRLIFAATELLSAEPDRAKNMEEDIGGLADRMEKLVK